MRIPLFLKHLSKPVPSRRRNATRRLAVGFEQLDARRVLASITGVVFADADQSGIQDNGESGLEDRIVYIDQNFDGQPTSGEPLRRTDSQGRFSFDDLPVSGHVVRVFDGTSTQQLTSPASGRHQAILPAIDSVYEANFGLRIHGENNAPTSEPVAYETVKDDGEFFVIRPLGVVEMHGEDALDQRFIALQTSESTNGTITIQANGDVRYEPLAGFVGKDTATYVLHDGRDASESLTLTVEVVADDEDLQGVSLEGDPLVENSPAGTVIGQLRVVNPALQNIVAFGVVDARFRIEDDLLILADPFAANFEMNPELRVLVDGFAAGNIDPAAQWEVIVPVANANDPIMSITASVVPTVFEHDAGVVLGDITVMDEDTAEVHEIQVDDDRFEVVDGNLQLREGISLIFPDDNGVMLTIFVNDPARDGDPVSTQITLEVQNVNDPPSALHVSGEVREKTLGAVVGSVSVVDPDPGDLYIYAVSDSRFEVVDGILKLKDDQTVTYDAADPSISLTVTATESTNINDSIEANVSIPIIESPSPWQNLPESMDVNNDGEITPQDALIILNALNSEGPRPLDFPFSGDHYLDVNGDGLLTPLDALIIVNDLNTVTRLPRDTQGPGGGFPPIGEAEPDSAQSSPEGESIAEVPALKPEGESPSNDWRFSPPTLSQPLMADDQSVFDDEEDWLVPDVEALFV